MNEELLNALKLIKEECKKHTRCEGCPLVNSCDECGISEETPRHWLLQERVVYF